MARSSHEIIEPTLKLWAELIEAMHGVNGYGSDVAELYAYRFLPFSPLSQGLTDEQTNQLWYQGNSFIEPFGKEAAIAAHELFAFFERTYDCKILIKNGDEWLPISFLLSNYFVHRIHVKVLQN